MEVMLVPAHENADLARFAARVERAAGDPQELVELLLEIGFGPARGLRGRIKELVDESSVAEPLPAGLHRCKWCGSVRGTAVRTGSVSTCRCGGPTCRYCGVGRLHRPISDHWRPARRALIHVPYFAARGPCDWCSDLAYEHEAGITWPTALEHPGVGSVIHSIRRAGHALEQAAAVPGRYDLVAAHASPAEWARLGFDPPPDDRPLYVGSLFPTDLVDAGDPEITVGFWRSGRSDAPADEVERQLVLRWRPPLRDE